MWLGQSMAFLPALRERIANFAAATKVGKEELLFLKKKQRFLSECASAGVVGRQRRDWLVSHGQNRNGLPGAMRI
jgi:hypothetical protein